MRKAFNHYHNIHEIKKQLTDKQYLLFDKALCGVQFLEIHIDKVLFNDTLLTILWTSIKHTMRSNVEGYCNKMKIDYESLFNGHIDTAYQGGTQGGIQQEKEEGKEKEEVKEQFKKLPLKKPVGFEYTEAFNKLWSSYKHKAKGDKWNAYKSAKQRLDDGYPLNYLYKVIQTEDNKQIGKRHFSTIMNSDIDELEDITEDKELTEIEIMEQRLSNAK